MILKIKQYSLQIILVLSSLYAGAQSRLTITKGSINNPYIVTGNVSLIATQSIILSPTTWIKSGSTFSAKIKTVDYIPVVLSNDNFVYTRTYQKALTSSADVTSNLDVVQNVTYFDGLGRAIQNIAIKGSPNKKDIITPMVYDNVGRQVKSYLPYTDSNESVGNYRNTPDVLAALNNYYKINYPADINSLLPNPFSEKKFEESPLNRIVKESAPGKDWAMGSEHEIKIEYQTNTDVDAVKYFIIAVELNQDGIYFPTVSLEGNYAVGQLYKTITKDENWVSGKKNNTTEEFKNKEGQVILKRTYADYNNLSQLEVKHDTYYLYDSFGNLSFVLPPKAEGSFSETVLKEFCYQYKYDNRNRLVEKKLPGKDWEYVVYDKLDRPILTQDANLRLLNKWLFTKYDAFSRPVYTGDYVNVVQTTRKLVQDLANGSVLFENKIATTNTINGTHINYTNDAFPKEGIDLFTINYYDNYLNIDLDGGIAVDSYSITPVTNVKGLPTASKVRILGTSLWTTEVTYYDTKGRGIYTFSKNNFLATVNTTKNKFDFVKVVETTSTHKKGVAAEIVIVDSFTYDHVGRILDHKQKINSQTQETIAANTYDNLGQLINKAVGGSTSPLQNVNYAYNIRGWLKNINDVNNLGNDLFAFQINYNDIVDANKKLFNGNISQTMSTTAAPDALIKSYVYTYDALNRLIGSKDYFAHPFDENLTYDKNGNITNLTRTGFTDANATMFGLMDNLTYQYTGNSLTAVEDASGSSEGFKNGSSTPTEYTYDKNGNMKTDDNKGIKNITYNYLNLPTQITFDSGAITYTYDATGTKQRKVAAGVTTDYVNGFQYQNDILQFFPIAEGYVSKNAANFSYIYQYTDHLGNIRLSYSDKDNDGSVNRTEIVEENDYYAFGLKQKVPGALVLNSNYKYKYNGKELQDELGLNMYDYGARNYDPALGRWMNIDPLAEKYPGLSPYVYCLNNPVIHTDPTGRSVNGEFEKDKNGKWQKTSTKGDEIGVDFYHTDKMDKDLNQLTAITDRKGNWNVMKNGRETLSGTKRGNDVDWKDIYSEWSNGTGPQRSVFEGSHSSIKDLQFFYKLGGAFSDFVASGEPRARAEIDFTPIIDNVLASYNNMQLQMMGSFNASFYTLGDKVLNVVQDSKSRTSFYYHLPIINNYERGQKRIWNLKGYQTVDDRESNTYQTYIFLRGKK